MKKVVYTYKYQDGEIVTLQDVEDALAKEDDDELMSRLVDLVFDIKRNEKPS